MCAFIISYYQYKFCINLVQVREIWLEIKLKSFKKLRYNNYTHMSALLGHFHKVDSHAQQKLKNDSYALQITYKDFSSHLDV